MIELPDRFWSKVEKTETCWLWRACKANGYGRFNRDGKSRLAHRLSYEALVGPIENGLELDHLCRNRNCVRPNHLEAVTHRENLMRGETLPAAQSSRTHCPYGHEYSPQNTSVYHNIRSCRECHRRRDRERYRARKKAA